jgi:hypothetical protein
MLNNTEIKEFDSKTGKFKGKCQFVPCGEEFWGRKDQKYCGRKCKNQVGNGKWREKNPKLLEKEKQLRHNYEIIKTVAEIQGYKKWFDSSVLVAHNFNGELFHSYKKVNLSAGESGDCIEIFDHKIYSNSKKQVYLMQI